MWSTLAHLLLVLALTRIGCDGVVGSGRVRDACGECGGDNSTCQIISAIFTEPYLRTGYQLVAQIPAGACSIRIEEIGHTKNYLALRDSQGEYIINGDWNIDLPGAYDGAGAKFVYRRKDGAGETISAQGPISEPIDLVLLYRQANRGIKYEYAIKNSSLTSVLPRLPMVPGGAERPVKMSLASRQGAADTRTELGPRVVNSQADQPRQRDAPAPDGQYISPLYQSSTVGDRRLPLSRSVTHSGHKRRRRRRRRRRHRFQWVVTGYTDCSKSCGAGVQTTEVVCMKRKRKQLAPDRECDPTLRPQPSTARCNTAPCPARWEPGVWSACSVSCGVGRRQRLPVCRRETETVPDTQCAGPTPPTDSQPCRERQCAEEGNQIGDGPAEVSGNLTDTAWDTGAWTPCSVTCGWGARRRTVSCTAGRGLCAAVTRPRDTAPCRRPDCSISRPQHMAQSGDGGWMVTEWSQQCSVECGQGVQWRQVTCRGSCTDGDRPPETRPCKTDRACAGTWFTGPWSTCSHGCGWGVERRSVVCLSYSGAAYSVVSESACGAAQRPAAERRCGGPRTACPARWHTAEWGICAGQCGNSSQDRTVACLTAHGGQDSSCPTAEEPDSGRACPSTACNRTAAPPEAASDGTLLLYKDLTGSTVAPPSGDSDNSTFRTSPLDATTAASTDSEDIGNSITPDAPTTASDSLHPPSMTSSDSSAASNSLPSSPVTSPDAAAAAVSRQREGAGQRRRHHRLRKQKKHRQHHRPAADEGHSAGRGDGTGDCADRFDNCPLVQQARLCKYKYYRTACCATCRRRKKH